MATDISQLKVDDLLRTLNSNIRETDNALDHGADAYNKWIAWRAQFASDADAATNLNSKSGVTWITAAHIGQWGSSFGGFVHLSNVAGGLSAGSYTAKNVYFDWNKIFN